MEYEMAVKGALKLKGVADKSIKKKKKNKNKETANVHEEAKTKEKTETQTKQSGVVIQKTKAQLKFEQMKEEQAKKRIMEKAMKTHKQRVEEFNRHLDNLTEHFDIPKVSWTK
nr:EOG090X0P1V [Cyclestheria hislopi]